MMDWHWSEPPPHPCGHWCWRRMSPCPGSDVYCPPGQRGGWWRNFVYCPAMEFGFLLSTIIHHSFSRIAKGKISLTSTNQRLLFRSRDLSRPIRDWGQSKTKKIVKTFMMSAQLRAPSECTLPNICVKWKKYCKSDTHFDFWRTHKIQVHVQTNMCCEYKL